jgi:hypothetical protein
MNTDRKTAVTIGVLFLIAAVASIAGLLLYDSILNDPQYVIHGSINHSPVAWGAILEIITAFAVIGTSVALYPVLKRYNETMALACVGFRVVEAALILIGILCLLTMVTLNVQWSKELNPDTSAYLLAGKLLVAFHNWTFLYGPNIVLGPSTLMTSYLLYKSKLVPHFIAVLGLVGGPLIFCCGLLVTLGLFDQLSVWGALLAIPVFAYEMSLAIWLIAKGFKVTSVAAAPLQNLFKLAASQTASKELF